MARINLNRVVVSSTFSQCFSITRTTVSVVNGRTVYNTPTIIPDQYGAISVAKPETLERFPDYQVGTDGYTLVTNVRVIQMAPGYAPDHITWLGPDYLVVDVAPYPQYGPGFWQVTRLASDSTARPQ